VAFKFSGYHDQVLGIRATREYRELKLIKLKEKGRERSQLAMGPGIAGFHMTSLKFELQNY